VSREFERKRRRKEPSRERARFGSDIDGDANLILRSACSHYAGVKRGRRRKTRASPLPGRPPGQRRRPVHACARSYVPERNETGGRSQSMQHHTAYVRGWPGEQSSSLHTHVHVVVSLELAAGDSITRTCSLRCGRAQHAGSPRGMLPPNTRSTEATNGFRWQQSRGWVLAQLPHCGAIVSFARRLVPILSRCASNARTEQRCNANNSSNATRDSIHLDEIGPIACRPVI
jgi:hypothetical protein